MRPNSIIYLTGAPASGKTSVAKYLVDACGARRYSYGEALAAVMSDAGYTHEQLRAESGTIIRQQLIAELDSRMPAQVQQWAQHSPVVIDTHAVTAEPWGLRSIPYDRGTLQAIGVTHLVCLSADANTLRVRAEKSEGGRPIESATKLAQLDLAQIAVVLAYAHTLGAPAYVIDASRSLSQVQLDVASCCDLQTATT